MMPSLPIHWLILLTCTATLPSLPSVSSSPILDSPQRPNRTDSLRQLVRRDATSVISRDFPDPALIQDTEGWTAFATNDGEYNVQVARSIGYAQFGEWEWLDMDALPDPGGWVTPSDDANVRKVWAPDVLQLPNGTFVMYYAAIPYWSTKHCIGAAYSNVSIGPYEPFPDPLACHSYLGGSIDPAGFFDYSTNRTYVVYKIDGNGLPLRQPDGRLSTPIMLQEVMTDDGVTPVGAPQSILDISLDAEGNLIEAPALVRSQEGVYFLTYSGAGYASPNYYTRYAYAMSITGPYTKVEEPLLAVGVNGTTLSGPGGMDIDPLGLRAVFHGITQTDPLQRDMFAADVELVGMEIVITKFY